MEHPVFGGLTSFSEKSAASALASLSSGGKKRAASRAEISPSKKAKRLTDSEAPLESTSSKAERTANIPAPIAEPQVHEIAEVNTLTIEQVKLLLERSRNRPQFHADELHFIHLIARDRLEMFLHPHTFPLLVQIICRKGFQTSEKEKVQHLLAVIQILVCSPQPLHFHRQHEGLCSRGKSAHGGAKHAGVKREGTEESDDREFILEQLTQQGVVDVLLRWWRLFAKETADLGGTPEPEVVAAILNVLVALAYDSEERQRLMAQKGIIEKATHLICTLQHGPGELILTKEVCALLENLQSKNEENRKQVAVCGGAYGLLKIIRFLSEGHRSSNLTHDGRVTLNLAIEALNNMASTKAVFQSNSFAFHGHRFTTLDAVNMLLRLVEEWTTKNKAVPPDVVTVLEIKALAVTAVQPKTVPTVIEEGEDIESEDVSVAEGEDLASLEKSAEKEEERKEFLEHLKIAANSLSCLRNFTVDNPELQEEAMEKCCTLACSCLELATLFLNDIWASNIILPAKTRPHRNFVFFLASLTAIFTVFTGGIESAEVCAIYGSQIASSLLGVLRSFTELMGEKNAGEEVSLLAECGIYTLWNLSLYPKTRAVVVENDGINIIRSIMDQTVGQEELHSSAVSTLTLLLADLSQALTKMQQDINHLRGSVTMLKDSLAQLAIELTDRLDTVTNTFLSATHHEPHRK